MSQSLSEKISEVDKKIDDTQQNSDGKTSNKNDTPFAEKQYEQLLRYLNDAASENVESTVKILRNWIAK
jgi:hypothetical protein